MTWGTVVVAGGRVDEALAQAIGSDRKCLAVVEGRTCLDRVLAACAEAALGPVAVVTGDDAWKEGMPAVHVPDHERQIDNARAGVAAVPEADAVLLLPADAPFLSAAGLRAFVAGIEARPRGERWLAAGLCPVDVYRGAFPECPKPSLRLRDGRWHSGAYFAASRAGFEQATGVVAGFSEDRRSQVKMAVRLGIANAFKFATGRFSLADGERVLESVFGCQVLLVPGADPESVVDIDDPKEYAQVLQAAKRYFLT